MKVLYFITEGLSPEHAGKMAEVVYDLGHAGHDVHVVNCNNNLSNCFLNQTHHIIGCAICQSRVTHLLSQAGVAKKCIQNLPVPKGATNVKLPHFHSLDEVMNYHYKGINIGRGAASSIISMKRDYNINSDTYGALLDIELKKAIYLTDYFERNILEYQPDKIYVFNGRFSECFPLIELAKKMNISYATVEAGSTPEKYMIFENSLPHSIEAFDERVRNFWNNWPSDEREKMAEDWFKSKRLGTQKNDRSYIGKQIRNQLPANFDKNKQNIVIFNSSEDEMKAIAEWETPVFSSQNEAIRMILSHFEQSNDLHFYLRVHPNLAAVNNVQVQEIKTMDYANLTILDANSNVDSYVLMEKCDKVICFGSTVGVEATYWGTPSILFGKSFYYYMNATYVPKSLEELTELINQKDLPPKAAHNTYPYGLYVSQFGITPQHYAYKSKNNSTFKGVKIKRFYWDTVLYVARYMTNLSHWQHLHKIVKNQSLTFKNIFKL